MVLTDFINSTYLDRATATQMAAVFRRDGVLVVHNFLRKEAFARLLNAPKNGKRVYIPDKHSFHRVSFSAPTLAFLRSRWFAAYASIITKMHLKKSDAAVDVFRHRDYTILQDDNTNEAIDFVLAIDAGSLVGHDRSGNHLSVTLLPNTFVLYRTTKNRQWFVPYRNHHEKPTRLVRGRFL